MRTWRLGSYEHPPNQCGFRFPNPDPDRNSPIREFTCTCRAGHDDGIHVAHMSGGGTSAYVAVAVALQEDA